MLKKAFLHFLLFSKYLLITSTDDLWFDKNDAFLQVDELLSKYGYLGETHSIVTKDGYILQLNRIISKQQTNYTKPVVLAYHGLLSYSGAYLINGKTSLGYYLTDNGYDVWLANARGSRYSNKHVSMDNTNLTYWDFDWHDLGVKDLPPCIDYIINKTGQEKINFIGHSQGCTVFMAFMAELPEYNDKIIVMHAMSPTISLKLNNNVSLNILSRMMRFLESIINQFGFTYLPLDLINNAEYIKEVCPANKGVETTCEWWIRIGLGYISKQQYALVTSHSSSGPFKSGIHYLQLHESGKFQQYDYGKSKNLIVYGRSSPPEYNTSNIKTPVYMHYGDDDLFNAVEDVEIVNTQLLPNIIGMNKIRKFGHYDFIGSKYAFDKIYVKILRSLNKYNKK